jgi:hypothetical protein
MQNINLLPYTLYLPIITSITTVRINRLLWGKKYSLTHLKKIQMTSTHIPISLPYKPVNCKNEISFIHKPIIIQQLFLVALKYVLPEDGPFQPKHAVNEFPI